MATAAIGSSTFSRLLPSIRQYEATTGRKISAAVLEAMLKAEYQEASRTAAESARLELAKSAEERAADEAKAAAKAARVSGGVQIGQTAITTGLLAKQGYLGTTAQGLLGGAPAVAPTAAEIAKDLALTQGAMGAQTAAESSAIAAGLPTPALNFPGATGVGTAAPGAATQGLISPALAYTGAAVAGYGIGRWSGQAFGSKGAQMRGGVGGGAVAGAAIGTAVLPGFGTILGGIIGGLSGLFGSR